MAKELGSLYYTIGIKGEKNAADTLKRVQDAVNKSQVTSSSGSSGASSPAITAIAPAVTREATALGKDLATLLRDVRNVTASASQLTSMKGELQARRMQLRSEVRAIESRRSGTAAKRQAEAAPLHAESMRLAGVIKHIDAKLAGSSSSSVDTGTGFKSIASSISARREFDRLNSNDVNPTSAFLSGGKGLGFGSTGSGLFTRGFMGMPVPIKNAVGAGKYQMPSLGSSSGQPLSNELYGPPKPPEMPAPWLHRINSRMTELEHQQLGERASAASARAGGILDQKLGYRINTRLADANAEVDAAKASQESLRFSGDKAAMDAANQRVNNAQNNLLDIEERRRFVAQERESIEERINGVLGTQVTLSSKIEAAQDAAVDYARQRAGRELTAEEEKKIREGEKSAILTSSGAHGGTRYANIENSRNDFANRIKNQEKVVEAQEKSGDKDPVTREYLRALRGAHGVREQQLAIEKRMTELREANDGEAPGLGKAGHFEYKKLDKQFNSLERGMHKYNQITNGASVMNNRWNTQLMELGYGVQDFTQVLAGGGGLSAALRGASNNMSQFFAVSGGKNAALWATGIGVGALAIGMALDSMSKQSNEAGESLKRLRDIAEEISQINMKTLSSAMSAQFDQSGSSAGLRSDRSAYQLGSSKESARSAKDEIAFYQKTRSWTTDVSEGLNDMSSAASLAFDRMSRGDEYATREYGKGKYGFTDDQKNATQVFLSKLNGEFIANQAPNSRADQVKKSGYSDGIAILKNMGVGQDMISVLEKAYKNKLEGESEKRLSDYSDNSSRQKYSDRTDRTRGVAGYAANEEEQRLLSRDNELSERRSFIESELAASKRFKKQKSGVDLTAQELAAGVAEMTPEAEAQAKEDMSKIEKERVALRKRRLKVVSTAVGRIRNSDQVSSAADSLSGIINGFNQQSESALAANSANPLTSEKATLASKAKEFASGYSPQKMQGESASDFEKRVSQQLIPIMDMMGAAATKSGENLGKFISQMKLLGDVAIDIAKAAERRDMAIGSVTGLNERNSDLIKDMASIDEELAKKKAENATKYGVSNPVLQQQLDQQAEEDANRKKKRRDFQFTKDENADKMFFGNKIASLVGGRRGAKLQAEMEYDQQLAAIEDSKMDPQLKAEKVQEAKDMREAELEKIDRKNVSFTDVGSTWKTIQSSLQADPNKKILSHWNKYMGLVTGDGIRVKLGIGT